MSNIASYRKVRVELLWNSENWLAARLLQLLFMLMRLKRRADAERVALGIYALLLACGACQTMTLPFSRPATRYLPSGDQATGKNSPVGAG